jgi:cell volume regulation protein A
MVIGGLGGYLFGKLSKWLINGIKLDFEGLYPVLVIALMFITFSSTDVIGGNGFLAVYVCAVYLGNHEIIHKKSVLKMFDGLAWLMQIILFLTLGLLVYPSHIVPVIEHGLLISIFLILVARPISVFISLSFFKINFRKKMFLSWVGLRGAVPIVFATYPLIAGIDKADLIFNIVFFVSLTSVLLQGTTLGKIADWLHVSLPQNLKRKEPIDELVAETMKTAMHEIKLDEENKCVGKKLVELNFPKSAIIAMIKRKDKFFTPNGSTILQSNDVLIIISNTEQSIDEVYSCLKINRNREE